jgi:hypothetical protein
VSAADAASLSAAREGRNFIAHQGAIFDIHQHPSGRLLEAIAGSRVYDLGSLRAHLEYLRRNVQRLARGDNWFPPGALILAKDVISVGHMTQ